VDLDRHEVNATALMFRSATDLKVRLPRVLRDAQKGDVVITMRGTPTAILRRCTPAELEAVVLLRSPAARRRINRALVQAQSGKGVDLQVLMEELGARRR
jgi:hypothetical protein